ncbi:MAG: glucose-6-phosphate dehydrogenase, partial [Kiritimatiellaceae bacterium]|nr:glucose-6-phosphate dehydrogenase [Kiritimatiellaceae bacterium]
MSHDLDEDVFKQEEIPGFSHDEIQDERSLEPVAFVIFGGAGDLSKRKLLPALYELFKSGSTPKVFSVIGFGIPVMTRAAYQTFTRQALKDFSAKTYDEAVCEQFLEHLYYVSGEFSDIAQYDQMLTLVEDLIPENKGGLIPVVFYLATPPTVLDFIIDGFAHVLPEHSRLDCKVVVEKPFGVDRPSAVALNKKFRRVFEENKIYRMDHYLGKETVQNILFFRFGNSMFEPLWSRRYIDHVQITVAEDIGIENRGGFYEKAGVVRDIIQNHMMQLIALIAMEPPTSFSDADYVRNEKIKIYKSIRPMDDEYIDTFTARGQYARGRNEQSGKKGYREENYVAKDSIAPTFIAAKIYIDTWRWSGVPFYIRAGKRLKKQVTEIYVQFKQPPLKLFGDGFGGMVPNGLVFSIQPEEEITMHFSVKQPGVGNTPHPVKMVFSYKDSFKTSPLSAYERLLLDCLKGDLTLFPRQDGIESMWEVVDTIIFRWEANPPTCFPNYFAGTWGPPKAFDLMTSEGRQWRFSEERSSEKIYKLGDLQEISDVAAKKFGELYQPGKRLNIALSGGRTPRN